MHLGNATALVFLLLAIFFLIFGACQSDASQKHIYMILGWAFLAISLTVFLLLGAYPINGIRPPSLRYKFKT